MQKLPIIFIFYLLCLEGIAQPKDRITHSEYIQAYKEAAIKDMYEMGVPASITLAQGILESDAGNSRLAREANNHFGIKCHTGWNGPSIIQDDDEKNECFRKYKTVKESYDDHSRFLRERPRYAFLFDYDITDYKKWAHGLKKAGYATNPKYAYLLIRIIEENNLDRFDKGGYAHPIAADNKKPDPSNKSEASSVSESADVKVSRNHVPFVYAAHGDTWYSIAVRNEMRMWQLLKYNDADESMSLVEGEIVYLKPKRGKPSARFHIVKNNESLRTISQEYGVKLKRLIKINHLNHELALEPGQKIKLK